MSSSGFVVCALCVKRDAIRLEDQGPVIELASCTGCGACAAVCKNKTLKIPNYTQKALLSEIQGLLEDTDEEVAIIGFFGDNISYTAADNAGTARLHYPTNMEIVRTPSTAILDIELLLKTLGNGADGIIISEVEESHEAELAGKLVEDTRKTLKELGIEQERINFQPMVLPIFKILPKFITDFTQKVKSIGKIEQEKKKTYWVSNLVI
jgi:heterodisulfide reductase subunit A